jgi:hypothetical protein
MASKKVEEQSKKSDSKEKPKQANGAKKEEPEELVLVPLCFYRI